MWHITFLTYRKETRMVSAVMAVANNYLLACVLSAIMLWL